MKINLIKKPNYLHEAISLIIQVMQLQDADDIEKIHISDNPERYPVPMEDMDTRYADLITYRKNMLKKAYPIMKDNIPLKISTSYVDESASNMTYINTLFYMLEVSDAKDISEEELLIAHLNSLLTYYYNKAGTANICDENYFQSFNNSNWKTGDVNINTDDMLQLISELNFPESLKWFALEQITNEDCRVSFIATLITAQEIVEKHFYLVEERYSKAVKYLENPAIQMETLEKTLGMFIENIKEIVPLLSLEISVLSYNAAGLKTYKYQHLKDTVFLGIIIEELMDLTGHYDISDERIVDMCKALGDTLRYEIINLLTQRPYFAKELAELLGVAPSTLSHHLSILVNNGFLHMDLSDRKVYYKTNKEALTKLANYFQTKANSVKE
ncbi:MAG: winged helix-turn-helix transcriptional regulator [Tissierellia bacterium]|nr:winged helix-turn-helix transcriptional regulator [Tissierellia bacterium]